MNIISENLKTTGIINAALIVLTIILRLISFFEMSALIKIDVIVCIISLIFGLLYSLFGYKKDVAKYYKTFMILYVLSSLISVLVPIIDTINGNITITNIAFAIFGIIILICACMLAFGKDLGKGKSTNLFLIVLSICTIKILWNLVIESPLAYSSASFAYLIQAFIVCVLVTGKYKDKQARGSK